MLAHPRLKTNNDRVLAREWMMPILRSFTWPEHSRVRAERGVREERTSLRPHHQAAGSVRRPAPQRDRRAGRDRDSCQRERCRPCGHRARARCCRSRSTGRGYPRGADRRRSARTTPPCCVSSAISMTRSRCCGRIASFPTLLLGRRALLRRRAAEGLRRRLSSLIGMRYQRPGSCIAIRPSASKPTAGGNRPRRCTHWPVAAASWQRHLRVRAGQRRACAVRAIRSPVPEHRRLEA